MVLGRTRVFLRSAYVNFVEITGTSDGITKCLIATGNPLTTMNDNSHTERQLIVAALNGGAGIADGAWGGVAAAAAAAAGGGQLCVFVRQSPCGGPGAPINGGISCRNYYAALAAANAGLILNVYFPHTTTSINQADVVGGLLNNLVGALAVLLPPPGGGAGPGQLDGGLGRFRLVAAAPAGGAILQFLVPATNAWINFANQAAGDAWVMAPVILPLHMSQFYNKINSYLGNAATATPNKVALFDAVYGAVNVNYIPV